MSAPKTNESSETKNNQPTALVAGGAGFIGSHLVRTLLSQNFSVVCVDNLSTGKKENLKDLLTSPNLTFIQEDINNPSFQLPPELKIDYCFHLASSEEHRASKELSLDTLLVNSLGTRQLLEIARANQAKFILASSADLYSGVISGSSLRFYFGKSPDDESVLSAHEAKRFAEALTFEYFKKFALSVTVVRLKDVYGPKMSFDRSDEIADLLKNALNRQPLKVFGDGLKILNPTFISEIFVLVNPEKITVENFAQTVKLVAGPLEIERKKSEETLDLPFSHLDLENTREKLSWSPKVSLAEGISSVIQSERLEEAFAESPTADLKPLEISDRQQKETVGEVKELKEPSNWLRLGIFILCLVLLLATIIYPVSAAGLSSWLGKGALREAVENLEAEKTESAVSRALSAQNSFEASGANLQKVSWLFKIIGLSERTTNFSRLLEASASLAESVRNSSRANQILIDTASRANLNKEEALETFR